MKERDLYFDFLKGIAILMVVGIHTVPSIKDYHSMSDMLTIIIRQVLNCAVPLFLAISGYFMAGKIFSSRKDVFIFWTRQISRVYVPMLIWGLGWYFLNLWQTSAQGALWKNTVMLVVGGYSIYYFVTLIIQCYIITPLILTRWKWGG